MIHPNLEIPMSQEHQERSGCPTVRIASAQTMSDCFVCGYNSQAHVPSILTVNRCGTKGGPKENEKLRCLIRNMPMRSRAVRGAFPIPMQKHKSERFEPVSDILAFERNAHGFLQSG